MSVGEALFTGPRIHETAAGRFSWDLDASQQLAGVAGRSHLGHGLTQPESLRGLQPESAEWFAAGPVGHEGIESQAFRGLGRRELAEIYFGNWQRDLSQVLAPMIPKFLPADAARRLGELIFEVVGVLAEAKFGRRLKRRDFGVYRWEEHIDNPRDYGVAVDVATYLQVPRARRTPEQEPEARRLGLHFWQETPLGLPNYLMTAREYVLGQLDKALAAGPSRRGRELFGNALHTVEDFYAHSNFVELGRHRLGWRGDPMTGVIEGRREPLRDGLGRLRLVTGVFLPGDTVISLQELLLQHVRGPQPGEPDLAKAMRRVLVRRLLPPAAYALLERMELAWQQTGIPAAWGTFLQWSGLADLQRAFQEQIERPLRVAIARLLHPLVLASAAATGRTAFPTPIRGRVEQVVEPSHSRLAKDDPEHPHYQLARRLAMIAAADFWREMDAAWRRPQPGPGLGATRFRQLVERYMGHPMAVGEWWMPLLKRSPAPVPGPQPSGPHPVLRRGARGEMVRELQRRLNGRLPPGVHRLVVDGLFGPRTEAATRAFQRANRLRPDGIVGRLTWRRLLGPGGRVVGRCRQPVTAVITLRGYVALLGRVEQALAACGRRDLESRLHILSGVYYGTSWSRDFDVERSELRNAGFQAFLARRYTAADDPRSCPGVGCGRFESLKRSQDVRGIDMGHALIGLNARMRRASRDVHVPLTGASGLEITTWVGDLGGATARLALDRVTRPFATPTRYFSGTDYGAPSNLEGDVAAYAVAAGGGDRVGPPAFPPGGSVADALNDYFVRRVGWDDRCQRFLRLNSAMLAGSSIRNPDAVRRAMAAKLAGFGGLYLVNFVRQHGLPLGHLPPARQRLARAADDVADVFLDRLVRCMRTGSFRP